MAQWGRDRIHIGQFCPHSLAGDGSGSKSHAMMRVQLMKVRRGEGRSSPKIARLSTLFGVKWERE